MFKKKAKTDAPADAAEAAPEGEAPDGGKKKPPIMMLAIAGAAALVVVGGGGGAAFFLMAPKGGKAEAPKAHKHEKKGGDGKDAKPGDKNAAQISDGPNGVIYYTLPDMVVNMQSADGKPTFLKLKLTFELPDDSVVDAIEPNRPRLQDMFQTFLRELRPEDLAGSQGAYQLRMEILRRVNLVVAPAKVNSVLIEEMLIN
jgi:flagellar FliL protein